MKNILLPLMLLLTWVACKSPATCVEKIDPACPCSRIYAPVCGCNNKTYDNSCMAECAGIKTYTKGTCPTSGSAAILEGPTWRLITFAMQPASKSVPADISITAKFEEKEVGGSGGCNRYGGSFTHQGNSLQVAELVSTKMYCQQAASWETLYFNMLQKSESYTLQGDMLKIDCGASGQLIFQR